MTFGLNWFLLLLCSYIIHAAHAGTAIADDNDAGMFYSGLWIPDGDPNTFGHHDTWTNQSGSSVTFDFIGTQIQVFATRRPEGTYLTNVSFSIDGGPPTLWTSSDFVPQITYRNLVYTSPSLPPSQHHITITNLGSIFWLDYVQFTTADVPIVPPDNGNNSQTDTTTANTTPPTTSQARPPSTTPHTNILSSQTSHTSDATASLTSHATSSAPGTSPGTSPTPASSVTPLVDPHSDYSRTLASMTDAESTSRTDSMTTAPAVTANVAQSSSSRTPVIVGVVVGVLGVLALLLATLWWLRMRTRARTVGSEPEMTFAIPSDVGIHAAYSSKEAPLASPPATPYSGVPLLGTPIDPYRDRYVQSHNPPSSSGYPESRPDSQDALQLNAKLSEDRASAMRSSELAGSGPLVSGPRRSLPTPDGPISNTTNSTLGENPHMSMATSIAHTSSTSPYYAPSAASHSASSALSSQTRTLRPVRESRDAGVRLAGGPLGESENWDALTYDEVETLPPSYAQLHGFNAQ